MEKRKMRRNELCSCGSGKKYKHCCEGKAVEKANVRTKWAALIVGGLLLLGIFAAVSSWFSEDQVSPQPGRVWSAEHNHWH